MDINSVISALIGGGMTLIGVLIQNSKAMAVMQEKIENLTKQVEKHNNVIERTYNLESKVNLLEHDMEKIGGTE